MVSDHSVLRFDLPKNGHCGALVEECIKFLSSEKDSFVPDSELFLSKSSHFGMRKLELTVFLLAAMFVTSASAMMGR